MSQPNYAKLAGEGRAFDASRAWTEEELSAQNVLIRERKLDRRTSADFIRNGVFTPEAYDKALETGFAVESIEEMKNKAVAEKKEAAAKALGETKKKAKGKK